MPSDDPTDVLAKRVEELEELRKAEHEVAFSGDQRDVTGELSTVDQHPADVADLTYQRELTQTTQRIIERDIEQAQQALRRHEQGQYGICKECGRDIGAERLNARPEATLCIECQRRIEGDRSS
jgi:DnaK suppressor protein